MNKTFSTFCIIFKHVCNINNMLYCADMYKAWIVLSFLCFVSLDSPSVTSDGHTIDVTEGSAASISCPVDGNPRPNITWYKGNDTSSKIINKSTLEFPDTTLSDSGWYTCFAENSLGKVTARVHLLVGKLNDKWTVFKSCDIVQLTDWYSLIIAIAFKTWWGIEIQHTVMLSVWINLFCLLRF